MLGTCWTPYKCTMPDGFCVCWTSARVHIQVYACPERCSKKSRFLTHTHFFLIVENVLPFPSNLPPVGVCFLSEEQDAALCVGVLAGVTPILPSQVPGHLCDVRAPAPTSVRSPLLSEKPAVLLKWRDVVWFLCFFERHASR